MGRRVATGPVESDVRVRRQAAGLSQQDLADQAGLTRQAVSAIEGGSSRPPAAAGAPVSLYVRPDAVALVRPGDVRQPEDSTLLRGRIVDDQYLGPLHTLYVRLLDTLAAPYSAGAPYDLEVDIAAHPYRALGVGTHAEWTLALPFEALHVTAGAPDAVALAWASRSARRRPIYPALAQREVRGMAADGDGLHQVAPAAVDGPHLAPGEVRRVHPRVGDGQPARAPRQQRQEALGPGAEVDVREQVGGEGVGVVAVGGDGEGRRQGGQGPLALDRQRGRVQRQQAPGGGAARSSSHASGEASTAYRRRPSRPGAAARSQVPRLARQRQGGEHGAGLRVHRDDPARGGRPRRARSRGGRHQAQDPEEGDGAGGAVRQRQPGDELGPGAHRVAALDRAGDVVHQGQAAAPPGPCPSASPSGTW